MRYSSSSSSNIIIQKKNIFTRIETIFLFLVTTSLLTTKAAFATISKNRISSYSNKYGNTNTFQPFLRHSSTNSGLFIVNNKSHIFSIRGGSASASTSTSLASSSTKSNNDNNIQDNNENFDFGSKKMEEILNYLEITQDNLTNNGLSTSSIQKRLETYGRNTLIGAPAKSIYELILEQLNDRLVQILCVVALISGVFSYMERGSAGAENENLLESFVEPIIIILILIMNAAVGVWQSKSASNSLEALKRLQPSYATVIRDDGIIYDNIDASTLVPGDVIIIKVGDKIPSDAKLLKLISSSLSVDESSLTGESETVQKTVTILTKQNALIQDQKGLLFSGCMITSGSGIALVIKTGMDTQIGQIQRGVTEAQETITRTPLSIKLDEFTDTLTIIIGVICLSVFLLSIPKFNDPSFGDNVYEGAIYYAKVAVALGVAAIPEGLPAVITLCLSLGTKRMAKRNVIVRKLPSVETLGCTTVICSDKTGTLTLNEMTVVSLVIMNDDLSIEEHAVTGLAYDPNGYVNDIDTNVWKNKGVIHDIVLISSLCNDARILKHVSVDTNDNSGIETISYERIGEPTEAALCILAEKLMGPPLVLPSSDDSNSTTNSSFSVPIIREHYQRQATLEFTRDRKSMSVLCSSSNTDDGTEHNENTLYVKGAPNLLYPRCTHVKLRSGEIIPLTTELRTLIHQKTTELASKPLRCLALAMKSTDVLEESLQSYNAGSGTSDGEDDSTTIHPLLSDQENYKNIESDLILVGLVGIKDPPRPEVKDSIQQCSDAGIRVIMITGDAKDTAVAIAKEVNIFKSDDDDDDNDNKQPLKAFEGREFFNKEVSEQLHLLRTDNLVFCRAEPRDKQRLIQMLQRELNEIPAMTGDGVNDAPALQQSAIGIAMGITGTEVAKEASDMILVDDNFATIVSAVEEGRCIYANMQAFICFLISCNIGEVFAILLATIAGFPEPLTAMHLLWVNLVTDGPPATALSFNPPAPDLMKALPRRVNEPIMTRWLLTRYCLTGLYVGLATVAVYVLYYMDQGVTLSQLSTWSKCGELWSPTNSKLCTDLFSESARRIPQTLSLTTLVCMEMLKALSAVSVDSSLFTLTPFENPYLILGVSVPFILHLIVVYSESLGLPWLGQSFGVVPLSANDWITILKFSIPILLVDEILKAVGRRVNQEKADERMKEAITLREQQ